MMIMIYKIIYSVVILFRPCLPSGATWGTISFMIALTCTIEVDCDIWTNWGLRGFWFSTWFVCIVANYIKVLISLLYFCHFKTILSINSHTFAAPPEKSAQYIAKGKKDRAAWKPYLNVVHYQLFKGFFFTDSENLFNIEIIDAAL